jgi:ferrous iron transport protein B
MDAITAGVNALAGYLRTVLPDNALRSLLLDGVLAGAGSVWCSCRRS